MEKSPTVPDPTPKVDNGNQKAKPTYGAPQTRKKKFRRCVESTEYYFDISDDT